MLVSEVSFRRRMGPTCSSGSVPADERGIPGVCGGVGGGKRVLQVVGNFWLSRDMANLGWRNIADRLGVGPLIDLPAK